MENEPTTRNITGPYRDNQNNPSKFRVIAGVYRDKIIAGAKGYTPGCSLPPSRELATKHNTTRPTIEKAMQALLAEGLLIANGNQPPVVAERFSVVPSLGDRVATLRTTGKILPDGETCEVLEAHTVECPEHIAQALNVEPGSEVMFRRRVTRRHNRPIAYSDSYYPPFAYEAAPELGEKENIPGGAREAAVYALEQTQEEYIELDTSRIAHDWEKQLLELSGKFAVVTQTLRMVYLDDGRTIEAAVKVNEGSQPVVHRGKMSA